MLCIVLPSNHEDVHRGLECLWAPVQEKDYSLTVESQPAVGI